jgi:hypothetical protein
MKTAGLPAGLAPKSAACGSHTKYYVDANTKRYVYQAVKPPVRAAGSGRKRPAAAQQVENPTGNVGRPLRQRRQQHKMLDHTQQRQKAGKVEQ